MDWAAPRQWSESAGRGLLKTPGSSFPALQLDEFVKVVPGLTQVLYAALVAPAADVLDYVALKVAQRVSGDVVPRLDDFVFVVDSCHLLGVGSHFVRLSTKSSVHWT